MSEPPLRRSLGQHHLRHAGLCAPLVAFLEPSGRPVVEIGPGGGVLTAELLRSGARVMAVEADAAWAVRLRRLPIALWVADALTVDWSRLPAGSRLAGNLPYGIATALIERLLPLGHVLDRAGFLVQREVADRLLAHPGEPAYGSLSVLLAAACRRRSLGRVRPGSFRPPPKVESTFIGLTFQPLAVELREWPAFVTLVRSAFAQRRKTLRNTLGAAWGRERAAAALAAAGIPSRKRAQELDLETFVRLHRVSTPSLPAGTRAPPEPNGAASR